MSDSLFYEDGFPNGGIWRREWGAYKNILDSMLDSDTSSIQDPTLPFCLSIPPAEVTRLR